MNINNLAQRAAGVCRLRNWKKDWSAGGCYLHLEASEFIESLRGKGGNPEEEAADVFITLLALMGEYNIDGDNVEAIVNRKLIEIENGTLGDKIDKDGNRVSNST